MSPIDELEVPIESRPAHIAVIMDGNGRWANNRGMQRIEGHRRGAETVDLIVTEARRVGCKALTLYSFSSENWKRPADEVDFLMDLCVDHLKSQRERLLKNDIRFRRIGIAEGLPDAVLRETALTEEATKECTGMTLCLALNYGGRAEILRATQALIRGVQEGRLDLEAIDEACLSSHLDTAGLPDPDLLLRTAGEMRLSNFLLWQISYAELFVTETLWPDFGIPDFHDAIRAFASRDRRYGGLTTS